MILSSCKETILKENFYIIKGTLPLSIKGFAFFDLNSELYTIILNCAHDIEILKNSLRHELRHIFEKDFFSNMTVEEIETKNHKERP